MGGGRRASQYFNPFKGFLPTPLLITPINHSEIVAVETPRQIHFPGAALPHSPGQNRGKSSRIKNPKSTSGRSTWQDLSSSMTHYVTANMTSITCSLWK